MMRVNRPQVLARTTMFWRGGRVRQQVGGSGVEVTQGSRVLQAGEIFKGLQFEFDLAKFPVKHITKLHSG
jgi:hypothetical protein